MRDSEFEEEFNPLAVFSWGLFKCDKLISTSFKAMDQCMLKNKINICCKIMFMAI